jgi:hypothetical protein
MMDIEECPLPVVLWFRFPPTARALGNAPPLVVCLLRCHTVNGMSVGHFVQPAEAMRAHGRKGITSDKGCLS